MKIIEESFICRFGGKLRIDLSVYEVDMKTYIFSVLSRGTRLMAIGLV